MTFGPRRIGEHTLGRELGRGGMGVVYEGHHPRFGAVAIKLMLDPTGDPEAVARLRREAGALLLVQHPSVVRVHEVGVHEGRPFIAMAFVPGESLQQRLRRGPLEPARAAAVARALADALAHLHGRGIIHRDLKPANVILALGTEAPVLVDFGLARAAFDRQRLTATGTTLGTPAYMPPEQALGLAPTPAVDVYALGATLYEMLCGRPPFEGPNALRILSAVAEGSPPPPPSEVLPGVDPELERVCLWLMERDPARRPTADEARAALAAWRPPRRRGPPRRRAALVAGAAASLLVLGGAVAAARRGTEPASVTDAAPVTEAPPVRETPASEAAPASETPPVREAPSVSDAPASEGPETPTVVDEGERRAVALLRRAVPLAGRGRRAAADVLAESEDAAQLAPRSARVRLACAWVARVAARAGVADPPDPLFARAGVHLEAAAAAGADAQAQALREALARDRQELDELARRRAAASSAYDRFAVATTLRGLGRLEEAAALLRALQDEAAAVGDVGLWIRVAFNLAGALAGQGEVAAAEDLYRTIMQAVQGDPELRDAFASYLLWCRLRLSDIGMTTERYDLTLVCVDEVLDLPRPLLAGGDRGVVLTHRALALARSGRAPEALAPAREAIDCLVAGGKRGDASLAQPHAALACALAATDQADSAREALEVAFALAEETTLDQQWIRAMVRELALQAFPDDPAVRARADALFP